MVVLIISAILLVLLSGMLIFYPEGYYKLTVARNNTIEDGPSKFFTFRVRTCGVCFLIVAIVMIVTFIDLL